MQIVLSKPICGQIFIILKIIFYYEYVSEIILLFIKTQSYSIFSYFILVCPLRLAKTATFVSSYKFKDNWFLSNLFFQRHRMSFQVIFKSTWYMFLCQIVNQDEKTNINAP